MQIAQPVILFDTVSVCLLFHFRDLQPLLARSPNEVKILRKGEIVEPVQFSEHRCSGKEGPACIAFAQVDLPARAPCIGGILPFNRANILNPSVDQRRLRLFLHRSDSDRQMMFSILII